MGRIKNYSKENEAKFEFNYIEILIFLLITKILGGLLLSVQDSAAAEEVEQVTQPDIIPNDNTTNLLSSGESLNFFKKFFYCIYFFLKY